MNTRLPNTIFRDFAIASRVPSGVSARLRRQQNHDEFDVRRVHAVSYYTKSTPTRLLITAL
eukprot:1269742-Prymnesium_polylepis.1